jgi:pyrroloquinoline quinone biosynthesis protein D
MHYVPQKRASVVQRDLGTEAMLYDPDEDRVVRLNPTARRIWELCNGRNSVDTIAAQLRDEFALDSGVDLRADVVEAVVSFAASGLLTSAVGPSDFAAEHAISPHA